MPINLRLWLGRRRVARDPLSYGTLWLAIMGIGEWENVRKPEKCAPIWIFRLMRSYANNCREKAKRMGSLLREYPPRQRHRWINFLLAHIWQTTGRPHDKEIARLVSAAYEAVGKDEYVTEVQIKKHRQRHVAVGIKELRRIRQPSRPTTTSTLQERR